MRKFVPPRQIPPTVPPPASPAQRPPPQQAPPARPTPPPAPPGRRPTPPAPPSSPPAKPPTPTVPYATATDGGGRRPPGRALAAIGLVLSLAYVGMLVVIGASKVGAWRALFNMAQSLPWPDTYAFHLYTYALALAVMTAVALFPVFACLQMLRRRSPAGLLIAYAMIQFTLVVVYFSSTAYLVSQGAYVYQSPPGVSRTIAVSPNLLANLPKTLLLYSAPLLAMPALLVRGVRRAVFPR